MPAVAIVTLVAVGLTVVVLAAYLITVAVILRQVSARLTAVIAAISAISEHGEPVAPLISAINRELDGVRASFDRLDRKVADRGGEQPAVEDGR